VCQVFSDAGGADNCCDIGADFGFVLPLKSCTKQKNNLYKSKPYFLSCPKFFKGMILIVKI